MKLRADGQSNILFSNQVYALDGAIHGAIFPWSRDTRAFLLLNHHEIFACLLLTGNQMIFHKFFKDPKLHSRYGLVQFFLVFEKFTHAYLFQIALDSFDYLYKTNSATKTPSHIINPVFIWLHFKKPFLIITLYNLSYFGTEWRTTTTGKRNKRG